MEQVALVQCYRDPWAHYWVVHSKLEDLKEATGLTGILMKATTLNFWDIADIYHWAIDWAKDSSRVLKLC